MSYVNYKGEEIRVETDLSTGQTRYNVFLPQEEGHLVIHCAIDKDGNIHWFEGDQVTPRAEEIGKLLTFSDES